MIERYQMVACIGLRKSESDEMVTVPLYIKVRAEEGSPRRYEQQLADFIKNKQKGEGKNEQNRKRKTV